MRAGLGATAARTGSNFGSGLPVVAVRCQSSRWQEEDVGEIVGNFGVGSLLTFVFSRPVLAPMDCRSFCGHLQAAGTARTCRVIFLC